MPAHVKEQFREALPGERVARGTAFTLYPLGKDFPATVLVVIPLLLNVLQLVCAQLQEVSQPLPRTADGLQQREAPDHSLLVLPLDLAEAVEGGTLSCKRERLRVTVSEPSEEALYRYPRIM